MKHRRRKETAPSKTSSLGCAILQRARGKTERGWERARGLCFVSCVVLFYRGRRAAFQKAGWAKKEGQQRQHRRAYQDSKRLKVWNRETTAIHPSLRVRFFAREGMEGARWHDGGRRTEGPPPKHWRLGTRPRPSPTCTAAKGEALAARSRSLVSPCYRVSTAGSSLARPRYNYHYANEEGSLADRGGLEHAGLRVARFGGDGGGGVGNTPLFSRSVGHLRNASPPPCTKTHRPSAPSPSSA